VDQIDVQFSIAEETAAIVSNCVNRAKGLRQAVLRLAFDGQLVDRDPADEPAEVLLARIRTERAARVPATHGQKGGRKLRAVS
jgi:type I restriction enzyme, S subunit